ncbi:hypothetical protein [Primorskyibacter flagellatus]|uniref:Uncharacterized protein n=1 Tax=Primorskyibacter flagellatus TaxID=1387277 RepID=A0A1W1ZF62_9RHOB|nr:hypothetical protein [Primorskyibacter flagellatus]SMC47175.1 hypothetical protein SAMN06295998_101534 [Primorskyibacter flagellatus]
MALDYKIWADFYTALKRSCCVFAWGIASALPSQGAANDESTERAFVEFLTRADYENANFYLQNGLVTPERLDTGAIFYNIIHAAYWQQLTSKTQAITTLHGYLQALKPFDMDQEVTCGQYGNDSQTCVLLHDLVTGAPANVIAVFADLGLDLNKLYPGRPPATYDVIDRLGAQYSISDIQILSQKGMIFGDEPYDPATLAAHREHNNTMRIQPVRNVAARRPPQMPHNYLSIPQFNFMDALAVALGNPWSSAQVESSARDDALCRYITFLAPQMTPSFDYLRFVLGNKNEFRAAQIGERKRSGNRTYEPFPASCVALIEGMAQNHGNLTDVIALFGARGDVEMARWLLSLQAPQPIPAQEPAQTQEPQNTE